MWPDFGLTSSQFSTNGCTKNSHSSVYLKSDAFQVAQKSRIHLGHLCKNICHQELLNIGQSGHTAQERDSKINMKAHICLIVKQIWLLSFMQCLYFWHFTNTTANHLGWYEPSSDFTKELHGLIEWEVGKQRRRRRHRNCVLLLIGYFLIIEGA